MAASSSFPSLCRILLLPPSGATAPFGNDEPFDLRIHAIEKLKAAFVTSPSIVWLQLVKGPFEITCRVQGGGYRHLLVEETVSEGTHHPGGNALMIAICCIVLCDQDSYEIQLLWGSAFYIGNISKRVAHHPEEPTRRREIKHAWRCWNKQCRRGEDSINAQIA